MRRTFTNPEGHYEVDEEVYARIAEVSLEIAHDVTAGLYILGNYGSI